MAKAGQLSTYMIKGGDQGRARMAVVARVLAPMTRALLDRFEPLDGALAADAGCGAGEVSFELATRVGPRGRVVGFDLDDTKLAAAREEAQRRGHRNVEFHSASVLDKWPVASASLVHVRFVLTHLARPEQMLARAMDALAPGGVLIVQDIDHAGLFCDPPSPAVDRYGEFYIAAARARGSDPFIGRRLVRLLEGAGCAEVESVLVQPYGRTGDVKQIAGLTLAAIAEALSASGIATSDEVEDLASELAAYAARSDTTMSIPRIFQAWGRRPRDE